MDSTSLKALKEMLPTADEKGGLLAYMRKCGSSSEANDKAYSELSECEKYMYTMLDVSDAAAKFECMLFRSQFKTRCEDFLESIESIEKACDEVRSSERLQTIMAMILTLVNEINTGGDGNEAAGFTLDALLKLNEVRRTPFVVLSAFHDRLLCLSFFRTFVSQAKAFDKKTSVLHYLVKLMKQNDESLLRVRDDLGHVKDAELVVLDSLCADIKALKDEIEPVRVTVTAEAQRLEEAGQLVQLSLKELSEQRTSVRTIASVPQYNKIDHHTGRTPMERFVLNAASRIDEALAFTDKVKEKFAKLLEYFGEDGNMASNDFFGTMNQFLGDFAKAVEQIDIEDKAKVGVKSRSRQFWQVPPVIKTFFSLNVRRQRKKLKKQNKQKSTL